MLSRPLQAFYHVGCSLRHLWKACCACWVFVLAVVAAIVLAFWLTGCTRKTEAEISNYHPVQVPAQTWKGDKSYAEANPEWVKEFYESEFRPYLSKTLVRWDSNFDCNKFSALFAAQAQLAYMRDSFHKRNPPQSIAIGEAWVARPTGTHSLVCIYTAQGEQFFEPQTGKFVEAGGPVYFRRI